MLWSSERSYSAQWVTSFALMICSSLCRAIEADLLGPLRRDAQIPEEILLQVKQVFLALPSRIQARILLTAIQHPAARPSWADETNGDDGSKSDHVHGTQNETTHTREGTAAMVRDLLSAGGVVAVKLAQVIAEDPRVRCHANTSSHPGSDLKSYLPTGWAAGRCRYRSHTASSSGHCGMTTRLCQWQPFTTIFQLRSARDSLIWEAV